MKLDLDGIETDPERLIAALQLAQMASDLMSPRPISEYHEDMGAVLWWKLEVEDTPQAVAQGWSRRWAGEAPYCGTPNDLGYTVEVRLASSDDPSAQLLTRHVGGWPGYHTHWTPLPQVSAPPAVEEHPPGSTFDGRMLHEQYDGNGRPRR